jgi:hypothetical protein
MAGADLSKFRYHTGARLSRLSACERCPLLFRDLGLPGMALYLSGRLTRLAGPMSPLLYLRSARYTEPYTDHEDIGRLVVLEPGRLVPWHSGVPEVYVAQADLQPPPGVMACVPQAWATPAGERRLAGLPDAAAVREVLGGREHDARLADLAGRIGALTQALAASEVLAAPLRAQLQSGSAAQRDSLRRQMRDAGIGERELCSAWHHLPREARARLAAWLPRVRG